MVVAVLAELWWCKVERGNMKKKLKILAMDAK
jgi:hypothetical protein